ncbi:4-alpha-glucanotransferase [Clostridia bacterium]|nr:4-alpha-glucanotransferase [Clostridia bacterium]
MQHRKSGVLAHPTSFPSEYGIGDLGKGAYDFIDFLKNAKQTLWQILPLGPTGFGDSPYQSFSTFAGNPYLISPEILKKDGLISEVPAPDFEINPRKIDYGKVGVYKRQILKISFDTFKKGAFDELKTEFKAFADANKKWLDDFALFAAVKAFYINDRKDGKKGALYNSYKKNHDGKLAENLIDDNFYGAVWQTWEAELSAHSDDAVKKWKDKLSKDIEYYQFEQFLFFKQWNALKTYANENDIKIIGDIPIFVALDSADVWANTRLFDIGENGDPNSVAGVPPDYFTEDGQLWGNPIYNWQTIGKGHYKWWKDRIRAAFNLVDILRIDHFIGFESYWAVPYGETTAINGKRVKGPGSKFFDSVFEELGKLPIIAEDLGVVTPAVDTLRKSFNLPGMKVLQFAFDPTSQSSYLPHNLDTPDTVLYTGTHDNDTTVGWYHSTNEESADYFRRYLRVSGDDCAWDLIRLAFSTIAKTVIVPVQDILSLGADDRMNEPGKPDGNWQFRYTADMLSDGLAKGLFELSELYGRNAADSEEPTPEVEIKIIEETIVSVPETTDAPKKRGGRRAGTGKKPKPKEEPPAPPAEEVKPKRGRRKKS